MCSLEEGELELPFQDAPFLARSSVIGVRHTLIDDSPAEQLLVV